MSLLFGTCDLLDHLGSNPSKFKRVPKNYTSLLHATWSLLVQVRFSCSSYSRGQPKPSKKNGKLMMAEKMIGKHANRLSEARGQFSS